MKHSHELISNKKIINKDSLEKTKKYYNLLIQKNPQLEEIF